MADEGTTTTPANGAAPAARPATGDTASLRAARAQLAQRSTELETLRGELEVLRSKADMAETLQAEIKRLKAEHAGLSEQHRTERALWGAGLTDPDEIELVRFAHGRLPEKDRPELVDWLDQLKKDPTKAPRLLAPVAERWRSSSSTSSTSSSTSSTSTSSRSTRRVNPNARTAPVDEGSGGEPTAEEWKEARRRALQGDRKLFDQLRARSGKVARGGKRR